MKKVAVLFVFVFGALVVMAQKMPEILYLKNGSVIKCIVLEHVMGKNIKIQTSDGSVFVYPSAEVVKIEKAPTDNPSQKESVPGQIVDGSGNVYHAIKIGRQEWLAENVRTEKLNTGVTIPFRNDSQWWASFIKYYDGSYKGSDAYKPNRTDMPMAYRTYGSNYYYSYGAAFSGKLCPKGWRLPTVEECKTLFAHPSKWVWAEDPGQSANGRWIGPNSATATVDNPGEALFFPAVGFCNTHSNSGTLNSINAQGQYWIVSDKDLAQRMTIIRGDDPYTGDVYTNYSGMPVRCIKE